MPSRVGMSPRSGALRGTIRVAGVHPNLRAGIGLGNTGGRAFMHAGPSPIQGHVFDAAAKALWRFDEAASSDNAVDLSGNYTLSQFGSPPVIAGRVNNGRQLNGSSMFFQKQGDAALGTLFNGSWTVETWLNVDPATTDAEIFMYNGLDYTTVNADVALADFYVLNTGIIGCRNWRNTVDFNTVETVTSISFNTWHHVALKREFFVTYSIMSIFIDGVLATSTFVGVLDFAVTGDTTHYIGVGNYITPAGLGNASNVITGQIDDMRISNFARAANEIKLSYDRGFGD